MGGETEIGLTSSKDQYIDGVAIAEKLPEFIANNPLTLEDFDPLFLKRCDTVERFRGEVLNFVSGFFQGGDRFYYDVKHVEISWRESDNVFDLAASDHATTRILDAIFKKFQRAHPEYGEISGFKDNAAVHPDSGKLTTWGAHENYLMDRDAWEKRDLLIPFLVTRQIFAGPGAFKTDPIDQERQTKSFANYFELSERAGHIQTIESLESMSNRAIINTRDEPHINNQRYRRLHLIVGDHNICAYTTALKFGTTHLVLRLLEEDESFSVSPLQDPVQSLQSLSLQPTLGLSLKIPHETRTALQIQRIYLNRAKELFYGENGQTDWILDNWEFVLNQLSIKGIPKSLVGLIDRFTKEEILRRILREFDLDLSKAEDRFHLKGYDKSYANIDMSWGLPFVYPGNTVYFPSNPDEVLEKIFRPSYGSRSSLRSFPLTFYPEEISTVSWNSVSFKNGKGKLDLNDIVFTDPGIMQDLFDRKPSLEDFLAFCDNKGLLKR